MTLGIVAPVVVLLTAIMATMTLMPQIRKLEEESLRPGGGEAMGKVKMLKLIVVSEYLIAVVLYFYLNHLSDIGSIELF